MSTAAAATLITLDEIQAATAMLTASPHVVVTPMMADAHTRCPFLRGDAASRDKTVRLCLRLRVVVEVG